MGLGQCEQTLSIFKPVKNEDVVQRVNKILVGWGNYFQCGYLRKAFDKVNWYVRNRLYLHFNRKSPRGYVLTKNGEARFEGSRRPSGRSPRGVPLYSTSWMTRIAV